MKKAVTYLFIVFLATLIFYGGAGVNLITYCCGDCRTEGVTVLLEDKCCDVHEHGCCGTVAAHSAHSDCCGDEENCDLQRISFDWSSFNSPIVELQPAVVDLMSFGFSFVSLVPVPTLKEFIAQDHDGPPFVCPRVYLNLLTTLLI